MHEKEEIHVGDGVALVDVKTGLFAKAFHYGDDGLLRVVMCNDPNQAHIFQNPNYLNSFISECRSDEWLCRRDWLRVIVSRQTRVFCSLSHLYELDNY